MSTEPEPHIAQPGNPRVRPRVMWGGTLLTLAGLAVAGSGVAYQREVLGWVGVALTALGAGVALLGGLQHDASVGTPLEQELHDVREGGERPGVATGARIEGHGVQERARRATEQEREFTAAPVPRPPLRPLAAFGLLAVGLWLLAGLWLLPYPYTVSGQDAALRDIGFSAVLSLCGLRLRLRTRSVATSALALLAGALLALSGWLLTEAAAPSINEIASGLLAMAFAAVTLRRD